VGMDTIKVNREEYIAKGMTEVGVQFDTNKYSFEVKPAQEKALKVIESYFNLDLLGIVQKGIKRSNEKREFLKLTRKVNNEVKESGSPYSTTIRKFEKFFNELLEKEQQ